MSREPLSRRLKCLSAVHATKSATSYKNMQAVILSIDPPAARQKTRLQSVPDLSVYNHE